jgi:2-oxoglutarate ferredoxin oxidoreductase subunit gamma
MAKFEPMLAPNGLLVLNSSLIEAEPRRTDVERVAIPCSAIARAAGDDRLVSVVALGGLIALRRIVSPETVRQALIDLVGVHHPALVEANLTAFDRGARAVTAAGSLPQPR